MLSKILRASAVVAALAAAPAHLMAQAAPAPAPAQDPAVEVQQITAKLQEIQQKALQDATVQAATAELASVTNAAAEKVDPAYKAAMERYTALKAEDAAARAAQDNAKVETLVAEAKQLQGTIVAARQKAAADPSVQAKTTEYKSLVAKKMVELDPETPKLIARLGELRK